MLKLGTQNIAALHLGGAGIQKAYLGEAVVFGVGKPSRLPEGYTEVEYIQSSGTQCIDTGVKPTSGIKLTIDVQPLENATSTSKYPVYSYYYYSASYIYRFLLTWNTSGVRVFTGTAAAKELSPDPTARRMSITIDCPQKKAFIEGSAEIQLSNFTFNANMTRVFLFGEKSADSVAAKLYSCQIAFSGAPSRDFVPCVDPTGAVGLYDLVEGKFYGNAGTGAFTAGPAV